MVSSSTGPKVLCITGAGISAESGIPTFRGEEGYWREGSTVFTPMEMATNGMFTCNPERVWNWYLMRLEVCRNAFPNAAHEHLVCLQHMLHDQLTLVTQNVDGLHERSGFHRSKLYEIHGNIEWKRCTSPSCSHRSKHPEHPPQAFSKEAFLCPSCGALMRPHVLWFDEYYNEAQYRASSAAMAASEADLLVVCGTSGSTSLPIQLAEIALRNGARLIDINPEPNPFSALAERFGEFWQLSASQGLERLLEQVRSWKSPALE